MAWGSAAHRWQALLLRLVVLLLLLLRLLLLLLLKLLLLLRLLLLLLLLTARPRVMCMSNSSPEFSFKLVVCLAPLSILVLHICQPLLKSTPARQDIIKLDRWADACIQVCTQYSVALSSALARIQLHLTCRARCRMTIQYWTWCCSHKNAAQVL